MIIYIDSIFPSYTDLTLAHQKLRDSVRQEGKRKVSKTREHKFKTTAGAKGKKSGDETNES